MINEVAIQGRITSDPILRHTATDNPQAICEFDIAYQDGYGDNAKTEFYKCVAWGGTAEFVERNIKKGELLVISGKLQNKQYQDNDGKWHNDYRIKVKEVHFCGGKGE